MYWHKILGLNVLFSLVVSTGVSQTADIQEMKAKLSELERTVQV